MRRLMRVVVPAVLVAAGLAAGAAQAGGCKGGHCGGFGPWYSCGPYWCDPFADLRPWPDNNPLYEGPRVWAWWYPHGGFTAYASSTDEDDEAELDGLHVVVGDFDRRRLGYSAAIVVDGIRFHLKTSLLIERPRRLAEPPDEWLQKVKLAPPPRAKGKPSMAEYLGRGFKPSDEISKPSRRELDDAMDRAGKLATALGYRLSYWLVPVSGPGEKRGFADG